MRALLLLLMLVAEGCSSILPKENPLYPIDFLNPGVKAGYTFGPGGGWTYGFDVSVIAPTGKDLHAIVGVGPEVNFTWRHCGTFDARLGLDLVSWFVGVEFGPSWVWDAHGRDHAGFGLTTWASLVFFDPYYTYTWVHGMPNLSELGMYAKLPICLAGGCGGGDGGGEHHWWHIDD